MKLAIVQCLSDFARNVVKNDWTDAWLSTPSDFSRKSKQGVDSRLLQRRFKGRGRVWYSQVVVEHTV